MHGSFIALKAEWISLRSALLLTCMGDSTVGTAQFQFGPLVSANSFDAASRAW